MPGRIELLLMRHGEAEDWAEGGDAQRQLTARGRTMAVRVGAMLRAAGLAPTIAISSPFVRAKQTMDGVLEAAGAPLATQTEPRLVPGTPAAIAVTALADAAGDAASARILAVGHNPCVTSMLTRMVGDGSRTSFAVSTGDVAHLAFDPTRGTAVLLGYIPARILEALAQ